MTRQPKVSIVVPVFKGEKYIHQCINSILGQTLKDIEVILVDDGSPDSCPVICDEYARQDTRVKVIHKANTGLGKTYNVGMAAATGEYIGFVESDDWAEPTMYEQLYCHAMQGDYDIVKGLYNCVSYKDQLLHVQLICNFSQGECARPLLGQGACYNLINRHVSHWSAIYRREFLLKNHIHFNDTPGAASQDFGFALLCYAYAEKVFIVPNPVINYRLFTGNHIPKHLNKNILQETSFVYKKLLADASIPREVFERIFLRIAKRLLSIHEVTFEQAWTMRRILKKGSSRQTYQYFSDGEKKRVQEIISYKWLVYVLRREREKFELFGVPIFEIRQKKSEVRKYVLGIPYYKQIRTRFVSKKYFCGVLYASESYAPERLYSKMQEVLSTLAGLKTNLEAAHVHLHSFGAYKNAFANKDVVLVCTGPTAQYYMPLPGAIHVGVNGAIYLKQVLLDYLFVQDNTIHQRDQGRLNRDAYYYQGKDCKKFFGILGEHRWSQIQQDIERVPEQYFYSPNVH